MSAISLERHEASSTLFHFPEFWADVIPNRAEGPERHLTMPTKRHGRRRVPFRVRAAQAVPFAAGMLRIDVRSLRELRPLRDDILVVCDSG